MLMLIHKVENAPIFAFVGIVVCTQQRNATAPGCIDSVLNSHPPWSFAEAGKLNLGRISEARTGE